MMRANSPKFLVFVPFGVNHCCGIGITESESESAGVGIFFTGVGVGVGKLSSTQTPGRIGVGYSTFLYYFLAIQDENRDGNTTLRADCRQPMVCRVVYGSLIAG